MRFPIVALATSSCVHAAWLRWFVDREVVWAPQETGTGHITDNSQTGWTPIPTPAPGAQNDGEAVLDLLKRQTSEKDWTNSKTCGWFSGISSSAVQCGEGLTCATNSNHAVACASGTIGAFYTACLDYSAFQAGSCSDLNPATGCCQNAAAPACGTYIWTGSPSRSMYQCFKTASVVSILDVPQFVLDASLFSKTHTTPKPTASVASSAATNDSGSSSPSKTGGNGSNSGGADGADGTNGTGGADGASNSGNAGDSGDTGSATKTPGSNSGNNTPIIIGSVVGGIAGLLALLILLLCLRRKMKGKLGLGFTRNKNNKKEDHSNKAYHTTNVAAMPAQAPKSKFSLCFGRKKKNKAYHSNKEYYNTNLNQAGAKGRNSSGSETTTAVQMPVQLPPQQHYHSQQQHYDQQAHMQPQFQPQPQSQPQSQPQQLHLHQQAQSQQPQYGAPVGGQQPSIMSYTMNGTPGHASQPSYSQNTTYMNDPSVPSSSGTAPHFIIGGIVPGSHQSSENQQHQQPQMQPYFPQQQQHQHQQPQSHPQFQFVQQQMQQQQQQQQMQQQGIPTQPQPVNHIHVYYAPPAQPGEPTVSNSSPQFPGATPDLQNRSATAAAASSPPIPDALGLFVQQHPESSRSGTPHQSVSQTTPSQTQGSRDEDHDDIPAYYGHARGMSANDRPSNSDPDAAWLATRGPGYRQSM